MSLNEVVSTSYVTIVICCETFFKLDRIVQGGVFAVLLIIFGVFYLLPSSIQIALVGGGTLFSILAGIYWRWNYMRMMQLDRHPIVQPGVQRKPRKMRVRVLNFDGALLQQPEVLEKYRPEIFDATEIGPHIRMGCGFEHYKWLEKHLDSSFGCEVDGNDEESLVTFFGSNDFHHVSLALIRRLRQPINTVLFDVHPDYLFNPFGHHCGCWYNLVTSLPTVHQAFHFGGGSGEFEDPLLLEMTPWHHILSGKMRIFPTSRTLSHGNWQQVDTPTVREPGLFKVLTRERAYSLLNPYREQLRARPLYITVDKDCLNRSECLQNWNSGELTAPEICILIEVLVELSEGRLIAIDITGDWSRPDVQGWMRKIFHSQQHDEYNNKLDPKITSRVNTRTNLLLLESIERSLNFIPKK